MAAARDSSRHWRAELAYPQIGFVPSKKHCGAREGLQFFSMHKMHKFRRLRWRAQLIDCSKQSTCAKLASFRQKHKDTPSLIIHHHRHVLATRQNPTLSDTFSRFSLPRIGFVPSKNENRYPAPCIPSLSCATLKSQMSAGPTSRRSLSFNLTRLPIPVAIIILVLVIVAGPA